MAIEGITKEAKRMKHDSKQKYPPLQEGYNVTIPVPKVDRNKGDFMNLI